MIRRPWQTRKADGPIDCSSCDACDSYAPTSLLEHIDGRYFCEPCIERTVSRLRRHRPAACVWYSWDGESWSASRTRTESATLVRRAAMRELHMQT